MSNANQDDLNTIVLDYAITAMSEYELFSSEFQKVMQRYHKPLSKQFSKCEAKMRTFGLSRAFVVASCDIEGADICFSDYSGRKERQTVLDDFPERKDDFRIWYGNNHKPYQHKVLFDHITQKLGKIGSKKINVNHPIGYCAEQNVANRLMLATDAPYQDAKFSIAIRPKTGEVIPYCDNCKSLFTQLNDGND